ncbi:uncharacterized BrkB/YihY/UPF0761 family membrane protein [Bacilli bacterium PM5-3]|nr:uncharacterized BrkB/YihY/UPF0761 family membrane protein [Bacilli bacterium PM5-3]
MKKIIEVIKNNGIKIILVMSIIMFAVNIYSMIISGTIMDEYYFEENHVLLDKYTFISWVSLFISFVLMICVITIYRYHKRNK